MVVLPFRLAGLLLGLALLLPAIARAEVRLAILGDSLTAGYGLPPQASFPAQLEQRLHGKGYSVRVINAGVSGDTTAGGLARLAWTLADKPHAIIVELGGNDALRGLDPQQTRSNLASILARLEQEKIPVLLAGMRAPRNFGPAYSSSFDKLFPELAREYHALLYPFFLEGVAANPALNQPDGIHPNPRGVELIVSGILPLVEKLLAGIQPLSPPNRQ